MFFEWAQKGTLGRKGLSWTLTFQKVVFISFSESPLKFMKNAFYFMLKALFILKIF